MCVGLFRVDDLGRPQTKRLVLLPLMLSDADNATCVREVPQGSDGKEADAAGSDHQSGLIGVRGGPERGVDGAGEGLDGDCGLVRYVVGYGVELRGVGDERALRPAATRVVAEARLDACRDVPPGNVQAQGVAARGAVRARRVYAADRAAEGRLEDDPLAGAEAGVVLGYLTDDLVAHHEGRRGDRGEVRRVFRGERPQIRAADTGEERLYAYPL